MNIAYCSLLLPEEKKLSERAKERLSGISGHKVTQATIAGIDENNNGPVDIFNIINTLNYPKFPQLIFRTEEWNHTALAGHKDYHLGYINILGIKYITQFFAIKKGLKKWVKDKKEGIICVHSNFLPSMLAAVIVTKNHKDKIKLCLNTGDIPGKYGLQSQHKKTIKQWIIENIIEKNILRIARMFDCFVFVTKEMATAFDVVEKPFTVVECTYSQPSYADDFNEVTEKPEKIIFYAGSIREEYGIMHLLRAFSLIKDKDYRLKIAGGGVDENIVKEYAQKDNRIEFLGFITPQEVLKNQLEAHVLVSPRQSDKEYVKYSFPSKSIDCLASGRPYVAHKLPCDPPEYENYIIYALDESDEALKNKLMEICELSLDERHAIGTKARKFILEKKSPVNMTKQIIEMWKKVLE